MRKRGPEAILGFVVLYILAVCHSPVVAGNPKEQVEYWQRTYGELRPEDDARVIKARTIFQQILRVAGMRPEAEPRLLLIQQDPWDISLPIALPDGWVVLSKQVLERLYNEPTGGDDRLAFVLAHEIAHQLNDDFWHVQFFQALEASQDRHGQGSDALQEVYERLRAPENLKSLWDKELQADRRGIFYAALAGFNTHAIVTDDNAVNFFLDWVNALDPHRAYGSPAGSSHPTPRQRAETVKSRLREIVHELPVFQAGLWFLQAGQYQRAIHAFTSFRRTFPSREVFHNLGASHHQLAVQAYQLWQKDAPAMPFQLSLTIDPETRATQTARGGVQRHGAAAPDRLFHEHIDQAIEAYSAAIAQDRFYTPAYNNLGCALILQGTEKGAHNAVTRLLEAHEHLQTSPYIRNNLGIAYFYVKQPDEAKAHLRTAHALSPTYGAALFNLWQIAAGEQHAAEAEFYRKAYESLTLSHASQVSPPETTKEHLEGLVIGASEKSVPLGWGRPRKIGLHLGEERFTAALYPNKVMILWLAGTVFMLQVPESFQSLSARGIIVGSTMQDVRTRYGLPDRVLDMIHEQSWGYDKSGIAFQLRNSTVVSWLLYPH